MLTAKFTVFILDQGVCLGFLSFFPTLVDIAGMLKRKHESLLASSEPGNYRMTPGSWRRALPFLGRLPPTPSWEAGGDPQLIPFPTL